MKNTCHLFLLGILLVFIVPEVCRAFVPATTRSGILQSVRSNGSSRLYNNDDKIPPIGGPPPGVGGPPPGVVGGGGGPPPGVVGGGGGPPPGVVSRGGPPPGVVGGGGGPPPGVGGGRGPPGAGGGPPGAGEQTASQKILEQAFEIAFSLLYLGDDSGIVDSSKNLRVLWTRALLSNLNKIDDDIAYELLPKKTKWVVGNTMAQNIWDGTEAVDKLSWIVNRTNFIDSQINEFISETSQEEERQIIVLGSGYDTRALRYKYNQLSSTETKTTFYEIDLPNISATKSKMVQRYIEERNSEKNDNVNVVHIPFDLNDALTKNANLMDVLCDNGFVSTLSNSNDVAPPTMVICEAVLFYLIPGAVTKIIEEELFKQKCIKRFCFTDNLSKVGVTPGPPFPITARDKCSNWLTKHDKELISHDSIWGGAIHFVGAK